MPRKSLKDDRARHASMARRAGRDIVCIQQVFDSCMLMVEKMAAEHPLMAQRFFGRAEALFAVLKLIKENRSAELKNLIRRW